MIASRGLPTLVRCYSIRMAERTAAMLKTSSHPEMQVFANGEWVEFLENEPRSVSFDLLGAQYRFVGEGAVMIQMPTGRIWLTPGKFDPTEKSVVSEPPEPLRLIESTSFPIPAT